MSSETPTTHAHGRRDIASENRNHFDKTASSYDAIPGALELGSKVGQGILAHVPSLSSSSAAATPSARVLEFACGTGLISREVAPRAASVLGVDISQGMVDFYNNRFHAELGYAPERVRAVVAEMKLGVPESVPQEVRGQKFDLVYCSMAYHHFADINGTTQLLASFLAPGGTLLVVDIVKSDASVQAAKDLLAKRAAADSGHGHGHGHDHSAPAQHQHGDAHGHGHAHGDHAHAHDGHTHGVAHVGGISEADIKAAFASAEGPDLIDMSTYAYIPFTRAKIWEMDMDLFIAKAERKAA